MQVNTYTPNRSVQVAAAAERVDRQMYTASWEVMIVACTVAKKLHMVVCYHQRCLGTHTNVNMAGQKSCNSAAQPYNSHARSKNFMHQHSR